MFVHEALEDGVQTRKLGPVDEWWQPHTDDGETLVGLSTECAYYILVNPSTSYKEMFEPVRGEPARGCRTRTREAGAESRHAVARLGPARRERGR
jgi:hypothetical protein